MKLLVVTQYFWPESFRINELVSSLVERGHDVEVLTGKPNYPEGAIFPSHMESFGLPLLEPQSMGLPIIASERDFVRDVVVPVETFDPDSSISIFRAVRRFLSVSEPPMRPLKPSDFLTQLMNGYQA